MSFKSELKKTVKTRFISGILVIVPLFVAIAVLKFIIEAIDNFSKPYLLKIIGQELGFPFMGLAVTLMLIILAGIFTTNIFGQKILKLWENIILRIPLFNILYSASKKLIEGFTLPENKTFENVVMVEYPRKGLYALGFLANRIKIKMPDEESEFWSIFIPSTPTPFSGVIILVPSGQASILDMTVEEGVSFFVSGSVAAPKSMRTVDGTDFGGTAESVTEMKT